jgi:hypothetical protein
VVAGGTQYAGFGECLQNPARFFGVLRIGERADQHFIFFLANSFSSLARSG